MESRSDRRINSASSRISCCQAKNAQNATMTRPDSAAPTSQASDHIISQWEWSADNPDIEESRPGRSRRHTRQLPDSWCLSHRHMTFYFPRSSLARSLCRHIINLRQPIAFYGHFYLLPGLSFDSWTIIRSVCIFIQDFGSYFLYYHDEHFAPIVPSYLIFICL